MSKALWNDQRQTDPSTLIEALLAYRTSPRQAIVTIHDSLTYRELYAQAMKYAEGFSQIPRGNPIVVAGKKTAKSVAVFLGAILSGHPFVPVDSSLPAERVGGILEELENGMHPSAIGVCQVDLGTFSMINLSRVAPNDFPYQSFVPIDLADCMYIMFTSGSTGRPKGIQISLRNVQDFVQWMIETHQFDRETFINQAAFNFDLSVIELWCGLATESTIWCIDRSHLDNPSQLLDWLDLSRGTYWVSTPSVALILLELARAPDVLPFLKAFLFCGEALPPKTADRLLCQFPKSAVYNLYGPTETTCAISSIEVTRDLLGMYPDRLPVGYVKPGTFVRDENGEIIIEGSGVGIGYISWKQLGFYFNPKTGRRGFRTGDLGEIDPDGLLWVYGRRDRQVKVRGNRVDLGDVEENLLCLYGITAAKASMTPNGRLVASVVAPKGRTEVSIREDLAQRVPAYMIPSTISILDRAELTNNGKMR